LYLIKYDEIIFYLDLVINYNIYIYCNQNIQQFLLHIIVTLSNNVNSYLKMFTSNLNLKYNIQSFYIKFFTYRILGKVLFNICILIIRNYLIYKKA